MPVKLEPASVIKATLGIENGGRVHAFFTSECAKAMDKFVPFDNGDLAETVIENGEPTANVGVDTIVYEQPYAHYVYCGISKNGNELHYNTDKHLLATSYWDQVMWSANGSDIIKRVQEYVNRGGK